jgi:hypothetical protein
MCGDEAGCINIRPCKFTVHLVISKSTVSKSFSSSGLRPTHYLLILSRFDLGETVNTYIQSVRILQYVHHAQDYLHIFLDPWAPLPSCLSAVRSLLPHLFTTSHSPHPTQPTLPLPRRLDYPLDIRKRTPSPTLLPNMHVRLPAVLDMPQTFLHALVGRQGAIYGVRLEHVGALDAAFGSHPAPEGFRFGHPEAVAEVCG